jgi:ElaB/YqjD/DUF883 family membrane-anchored ribosome-binding protein
MFNAISVGSASNGRANARDRALRIFHQKADHLAHEARLLKSSASDAVEDGLYFAKRALKTAKRRLKDSADLRDEAIRRVKREPLKAVGLALAVGICVGMVLSSASPWRTHS